MQAPATKEKTIPAVPGKTPPPQNPAAQNEPIFSRYDFLGLGLALSICLHWGGGEQQMYSVVFFMVPAFVLVGLSVLKAIPLFRRARWASIPVAAGLFLLVWGVIASAASGAPQVVTIFGEWGRADGLLTLLACISLMLAVATAPWWAISRMLAWVITAGGIVLVIGYLETYFDIQIVSAAITGVMSSTFGNPNFSAGFFATTGTLALFLTFTTRNWWARGALLFYAIGTFWGMVPNGSLQGPMAILVGIGAAIVATLVMVRGRWRVVAIFAAIIPTIGATALAIITLGGNGPFGAAFYADYGFIVRRLFWEAALNLIQDHAIFGVGPDGFSRYVAQYRSDDYVETLGLLAENAVHSVPLHTMVGYGLPGLIAWLTVFVGALIGLILFLAQIPRSSIKQIRWIATAVVAGLAAYITQAAVSIDFYSLKATGWFMAGAAIAVILRSREADALSQQQLLGQQPGRTISNERLLAMWGIGLAIAVASVVFVGWWSALVPKVGSITPDQARDISTSPWIHCNARAQWLNQLQEVAPEKVPDTMDLMATDPRCYPFTSAAAGAFLNSTAAEATEVVNFYATVDPKSFVAQGYLAQHRLVLGDVEGAKAAQAEMNRLASFSRDVDQNFVTQVNKILDDGYAAVANS